MPRPPEVARGRRFARCRDMPPLRLPILAAIAVVTPVMAGCTVVKPVVGALTGPVVMLGRSDGWLCRCNCDGRAIVCTLAVLAAIGAAGGLVTGIISDVQAVCGDVEDPTANWWDPFALNTTSR